MFMAVQGVVCFAVLFAMESGFVQRMLQGVHSQNNSVDTDQLTVEMTPLGTPHMTTEDDDVKAERARINGTPTEQVLFRFFCHTVPFSDINFYVRDLIL
jgi:hypothetical protein